MGKVKIPKDKSFLKKIAIAIAIMFFLIFGVQIILLAEGFPRETSFSKAISIITGVEIVNEQIGFKYVFTFLSMVGGVLEFYLFYLILEYLIEGKLNGILTGVGYMNRIKSMKDHYIIAGGGRVGSHAAKVLSLHEKDIVIADNNEDNIQKLRKDGLIAVKGDVLDEAFLTELNISKAKYLFACLGSDSDNILLVLTAREMNPLLKISARANNDSVVPKLKHAGAHHVVVPSSLGGEELAREAKRI